MTEAEWLTTADARALFAHLRGPARSWPSRWFPWARAQPAPISDRKGRLLALSWLAQFPSESPNFVLRVLGNWADGRLLQADVRKVEEVLHDAARAHPAGVDPHPTTGSPSLLHGIANLLAGGEACLILLLPWMEGQPAAAELFREAFGNPFRPVAVDPSWLAWNAGAAAKHAQAIYDDDRFDELPLLADTLEEAGCTAPSMLAHCREPRTHVRGCWVLDLLLGKE